MDRHKVGPIKNNFGKIVNKIYVILQRIFKLNLNFYDQINILILGIYLICYVSWKYKYYILEFEVFNLF